MRDTARNLIPELRERVLRAADALGYVKNAAASSLRGCRRGILAILVPQFGNDFFTRICVEVEEVARGAGFVVTICNSNESPQQERSILERLVSQRIDGHTPSYRVLEETGPDHDKIFTLGVFVGEKLMGKGTGSSKQNAQQEAAKAALLAYEKQQAK